jgi:ABC-type transporter Mla MlaB component
MTGSSIFTLALTGDISVKSAQDTLGHLKQALTEHTAIALDTSGVTNADVTTVQTLLAARTKAQALGKSLTFMGPPGAKLQAVLDGAGFMSPAQPAVRFWTEHI